MRGAAACALARSRARLGAAPPRAERFPSCLRRRCAARGMGQLSGCWSGAKAVPQSRLWHGSVFSHPVEAIVRRSTSEAQRRPRFCLHHSLRSLVLCPSPGAQAPTATWVCRPPHRIFRLSILFSLQGNSIDATSQLALSAQSYPACPGPQDSLTEASLPL